MNDENGRDSDAIERAQMYLTHAEDQWRAEWPDNTAPPRHGVDVRNIVHMQDDLLLKAAQVIGVGVGISPVTMQLLKNSIAVYNAGQRLDRGEITEAEYDNYVAWLYPGPDEDDPGQGQG
jgi:hypothetical protein